VPPEVMKAIRGAEPPLLLHPPTNRFVQACNRFSCDCKDVDGGVEEKNEASRMSAERHDGDRETEDDVTELACEACAVASAIVLKG